MPQSSEIKPTPTILAKFVKKKNMPSYGFCHLSVIPLRETPSDLSQMTTQLLFGDVFEVIENKEDWLQIKNAYDDYIGWIDKKQQIQIDENKFDEIKDIQYVNDKAIELDSNNEHYSLLTASSFPSEKLFKLGNRCFTPKGTLLPYSTKRIKQIPTIALSYLNAPYLWGGKTHFGIDCSGFTQSVYKIAGYKIMRDASQQAKQGRLLNFLSEANPGDLAFFDNEEENIIHVGILLENNNIIHSSGKVRIDLIDHQGIYNQETKSYSHNLRLIKTFRT